MGFSGQQEIVNIKKGLRIKKKNLGRAVFSVWWEQILK